MKCLVDQVGEELRTSGAVEVESEGFGLSATRLYLHVQPGEGGVSQGVEKALPVRNGETC